MTDLKMQLPGTCEKCGKCENISFDVCPNGNLRMKGWKVYKGRLLCKKCYFKELKIVLTLLLNWIDEDEKRDQ